MRSNRSFLLSVTIAASVTLLAAACSGNFSDQAPAGPSGVSGAALSVGGTPGGVGTISSAATASQSSKKREREVHQE